jgi:hypothetical protein
LFNSQDPMAKLHGQNKLYTKKNSQDRGTSVSLTPRKKNNLKEQRNRVDRKKGIKMNTHAQEAIIRNISNGGWSFCVDGHNLDLLLVC